MGTDYTPPPEPPTGGDPTGGAPPTAPPPAPVAAPAQAAGPAAPVVGAAAGAPPAEYDPQQVEQAMGVYRALNDPIGAPEAMTRLVQRHGQLPDWFTWDHAVDAMRNYAQFMSEMGGPEEEEYLPAGPPQQQQPPPVGATGRVQQPQQADFEGMLQRHLQPLQQRLDQYEQGRMQDEGARRAETISAAVDSKGLSEAGRDTLLNNVVYGLRAAMDQGQQVDFSPRAIQQYTDDMLTHLRSIQLTEQQQQIADHRGIAPQTRGGNGGMPTGAPVGRGVAGAASRAMDLARQWEAGQPG